MNRSVTPLTSQSSMNPLGKRKLTILMICWEYPPNVVGGLSRHVFGLSVQLAEQGHHVYVLTAGNGNLPKVEEVKQVKVHRVEPLNRHEDDFLSWVAGLNLAMVYEAKRLADQISFDLIHAHDWLVGASSLVLKETMGLPLLTTIHATEYGRNNGIYTKMQQFIHEKEQQLVSESNQLIVCSEYMKEHLLKVFGVRNEMITIIANGIEYKEINYDLEDLFPSLNNREYIFSIGRMVKEKGFETIIDTAEMAKSMGLRIFFIIAGKGPLLELYRQKIKDRNLESHISFIGYVTEEERTALIKYCKMAIFPSHYEPFGIVALETMVQGKPTIVSDTGGLKGIVKHLKTGLLMLPGDPASLLKQILFIMDNPQEAEKIGNRGQRIISGLYGWNRIADETSRIMEDTLLSKMINEKTETPNNK